MTILTDATEPKQGEPASSPEDAAVPVTRRRVDYVLMALGAAMAVVLAIAGGLLLWGSSFAEDYVSDELRAQNISFPDAAALTEDGREDLTGYAGQQVTTGSDAEVYSTYIAGHVERIGGGMTYAELGGPERAAQAAVAEATAAGASPDEVADLQATADELTAQRDTVFRGETLRGILLTTYAWSTIAEIAGIAAIVALAGAAVMTALVIAGLVHVRRADHAA